MGKDGMERLTKYGGFITPTKNTLTAWLNNLWSGLLIEG